jgi:iron complex outermembrane receptor protein
MPSTGIYNPELNPESGWSIEGGIHGTIGPQAGWHLSIYDFHMSDAIVLQRDSSGADYYVNAGDTRQPGIELSFDWTKRYSGFAKSVSIKAAITYSAYRFGTYVYDGNDYSGNALTGIPPWTMAMAADADFLANFYGNLTANYASRIPLNDSSTDYANEYLLVGLRVGKRFQGRLPIDLFVGVDNLLDQVYSLGNDLNAAGKRYFNAAPRINYYAGLTARLDLRRN